MPMDLPDLGHKVGPLPLWGWLTLGAGGVFLVVVLAGRKPASASGTAGSMGYAAPTTDQMTGNAINDLKNSLAQQQEATAAGNAATQQELVDVISANAAAVQAMIGNEQDAIAGLLGQQHDQAAAYQQQLTASNAAFFEQITALMQSFKGNGTASVQTSNGAADPLAGAPSWLASRLQAPYWKGRKYVLASDTNLGDGYSEAVSAFFRSDNVTGLNSAGAPSAAAQQQLNSLIASGRAALNPLYPG